jgi:hypothetical protein
VFGQPGAASGARFRRWGTGRPVLTQRLPAFSRAGANPRQALPQATLRERCYGAGDPPKVGRR